MFSHLNGQTYISYKSQYHRSLVRNKQTRKVLSFPLLLTIPRLRDLRCLAESEILKLTGKAYKRDPTTADSPVWEASFSLWAPHSPPLPKDNGKDNGTRNGTQVTRINPVLGSFFYLTDSHSPHLSRDIEPVWGQGYTDEQFHCTPPSLKRHPVAGLGKFFGPIKASSAGTTRSPSSIRIAKQTNVNHKLALVIGACHLPYKD